MGISGVPLDKSKIIEAIHENYGIMTHAAQSMGCNPQSLYDWKEKDPDVKAAIEIARAKQEEHFSDLDKCLVRAAYASAARLIEADNDKLVTFTLERKGGWKKEEAQNLVHSIAYRIHKDD